MIPFGIVGYVTNVYACKTTGVVAHSYRIRLTTLSALTGICVCNRGSLVRNTDFGDLTNAWIAAQFNFPVSVLRPLDDASTLDALKDRMASWVLICFSATA
jgi:hypothetical protein